MNHFGLLTAARLALRCRWAGHDGDRFFLKHHRLGLSAGGRTQLAERTVGVSAQGREGIETHHRAPAGSLGS